MTELQELRRYRRDLHRIPELDFDLPQTIAYIEGVFARLPARIHPCPVACALSDAGTGASHATAIRRNGCVAYCGGDSAALPRDSGKMHACGTTGTWLWPCGGNFVDRTIVSSRALLSATCFLCSSRPRKQPVALRRYASGVFERYGADRIFGFHVWPDLPAGTLASCSGPLLARSSETHIHIHGTSIHIAKTYGVPVEESHDAALAAAKFLVSERELMDELGADEPCIGKFGLLQAGTVCNAVAGEAHVAGSLRVFTDGMFDRAREGVRRVLDEACAATGCTYDLDFAEGYPPVDNAPSCCPHCACLARVATCGRAAVNCRGLCFLSAPSAGRVLLAGHGRARRTRKPDRR
ncbi:MAG: amidohydrolase [Collinsella sp.]